MDTLSTAYDSESDTDDKDEPKIIQYEGSIDSLKEGIKLDLTPVVAEKKYEEDIGRKLVDPACKELKYNQKFDDMFAPEVGPMNPFKTNQQLAKKNTLAGYVEKATVSAFHFDNQQKNLSQLWLCIGS